MTAARDKEDTTTDHYDVLVLGTGNAGIAADGIRDAVYSYPAFTSDVKYLM